MSKIFYIMGKSATGKDHIYRALLESKEISVEPLVLYTTRPMREGEENGREYWFSNVEELENLRRSGRIIEERMYSTVHGPWYYFTADNGQIRLEETDYLGIGTLESYLKMREYFGTDRVVPIYVDTEDGIRLERALQRERKQSQPKYAELCRRFLADCEDFSEEKIKEAEIEYRFFNNGELSECQEEILTYMKQCVC
ncbi:MAG: guanylate kinase [Eubacteriales bacterium]|nr:guanylate kinase [Eubacteriales bacterium]